MLGNIVYTVYIDAYTVMNTNNGTVKSIEINKNIKFWFDKDIIGHYHQFQEITYLNENKT